MKKVLFVDDMIGKDSPFGKDIAKEARKRKISVEFVKDPEKAIEMIGFGSGYDAVLMDGEFKGFYLQGPETVAEIRKFSDIPIVMISGSKESNKNGLARGANSSLDKFGVIPDLKKKNGEIRKALALEWDRKPTAKPKRPTGAILQEVAMMLLPLHIDMETLTELRRTEKDTETFLAEMYSDGVNYMGKINDAKESVGENEDVRLKELLYGSGVEEFFSKLSQKTMDPEKLLNHDWGLNGIKSFQGWFKALTDALRD